MTEDPNKPVPDLRASDAERERAVEILGLGGRRRSVERRRARRAPGVGLCGADPARVGRADHRGLHRPALEGRLYAGTGTGTGTWRADPLARGRGGTGWVCSILGGHDRRGHWRIARKATVLNVMGGSDVDLCQVELSGPETQLNVYSLMGGAEIRVPAGVRVEVTKFAVMGGHVFDLGDERPPADGGSSIRTACSR